LLFMRRILPLAALALLAGCASPAQVDVRDRMVGMSENQLANCMGPPARKEDVGHTETWTYYAPDAINARPLDASMIPRHHQAVADMGSNACLVTVKLEAEKVMAVDYINMASTREDDGCANSILRCSR
jgi:outer membrane protein assembly factor BamE (lipoprotein component of BamABCDE complex)